MFEEVEIVAKKKRRRQEKSGESYQRPRELRFIRVKKTLDEKPAGQTMTNEILADAEIVARWKKKPFYVA